MSQDEIQRAIQMIESERDTNVKQLLLAALVSELFRERGFELIREDNSEIIEFCWVRETEIGPRDIAEVMSQIPGARMNGIRCWKVLDLWVGFLGCARVDGSDAAVGGGAPDDSLSESGFTETKLPIPQERRISWEKWLAGRAERRRLGNLVAPPIIRRPESSSDQRLRAAFGGGAGRRFAEALKEGPKPANE